MWRARFSRRADTGPPPDRQRVGGSRPSRPCTAPRRASCARCARPSCASRTLRRCPRRRCGRRATGERGVGWVVHACATGRPVGPKAGDDVVSTPRPGSPRPRASGRRALRRPQPRLDRPSTRVRSHRSRRIACPAGSWRRTRGNPVSTAHRSRRRSGCPPGCRCRSSSRSFEPSALRRCPTA